MTPRRPSPISTFLVIVVSLSLPLTMPLVAQDLEVTPTALTWDLGTQSQDGSRLIVSGPEGFYRVRSFTAEENPGFSLFEADGEPLPDGTYTWELVTLPRVDPEVRESLRNLRREGLDSGLAARAAGLQLPEGERQSGYFAVYGSRFVTGEAGPEAPLSQAPEKRREITERATNIDELCVGFDCTTTVTYSDSNLVLRDTDTRLKFADTSTSSPFFSSSDWEIEINSADGGTPANYFGLNDCGFSSDEGGCASDLVFAVEAGARTNALYVEDDGQVGIGTASPQRELHLVSGDSPALRFDQDGTSVFGPYDWDLAANEDSFFLRDVTNTNTVPFQVKAGAEADTLVVGVDGEVAINGEIPSGDDYLTVNVNSGNGGITIESVQGNLPQLTLIEPDGKWRLRVNNMGNMVVTDATSGTSPFQLQQGANNNLLNLNADTVTVDGNLVVTNSSPRGETKMVYEKQ